MNVRISSLLVIAALVGAASCKDNPLADGSGVPASIVVSFNTLDLHGVGATGKFVAQVVDNRLTPLPVKITLTSCDGTIASVISDPTYHPVPATSVQAVVTGTALNKGCIVVSAAGVKPDTVTVFTLPVTVNAGFTGPANIQPGSVIEVTTGVSTLKFDTATAQVLFGTGKVPGFIVHKDPDSLRVAVPEFDTDSVRLSGILVTYSGAKVTLATPAKVTPGANLFSGDSAYTPGFDATSLLPAVGSSVNIYPPLPAKNNVLHCPEAYLNFGSTGPCSILKFVLAAPATLNFTVTWAGTATNPDIDIYACSGATADSACDFEDGGAGATGSRPQSTGNFTYPAGTHYLIIERFGGAAVMGITQLTIARQ